MDLVIVASALQSMSKYVLLSVHWHVAGVPARFEVLKDSVVT